MPGVHVERRRQRRQGIQGRERTESLRADGTDGDFALAEPHLIASGKRDSAITLANMMYEWSQKGALDPAPYAARGVLP
jgi:hypothetical protein